MSKRLNIRQLAAAIGCACLLTMTAGAVENPTKAIPSGEKSKVTGTIQGRDGETMRVRTDDNSVVVVDLTNDTKVQLKKGLFHWSKKKMDVTALVPGLRIEASGKGNEQGQLVADKVEFDPTSYRASRAVDTRVSPLESRTGQLEGRAGQLEAKTGELTTKTGELDTRTGQLADQQKQDQQAIGEVRTDAQRANAGVSDVNGRVSSLDEYAEKAKATVYFKINSSALSPDAKRDLDDLVQKTKDLRGYMIEIAGFTDTTGNAAANERLSERRAEAVTQYLQQADVPLRRILAPAGLGETHAAADNTTSEGRKLNRRVEVKVLVNNTLSGSMNKPTSQSTAPQPAQ
jgi:outer membrane protein OmpA-like peptidoglycan-associated protein